MTGQSSLAAWIVTDSDPEHSGKFVARLIEGDHTGGRYVDGAVLVAGTLAELRALRPIGLSVHEGPFLDGVLELWD